MIISEQWLRTWVDPDASTEELSHKLTMAGLEVDSVGPVAEAFSGVVVGEIVSAAQHPDADKLRVCEVSTGTDTVQIVCGAPNARAGLKAPLAQVGAVLPGNFKIKKAKLRDVESQGMLCAAAELTISEDNDGLMELASDAPVGADLRDYLGLDDQLIELGLTPNRADCLGMRGVARDVAVLFDQAMPASRATPVAAEIDETLPITIEAPTQCARYLGRVINNVDLSRTTPSYIVSRLERAGLRSIDAAVDVTNYVMLELGQPLHAFDKDQLVGGIVVRNSRAGETITLLDGSEQALEDETLLIADHEKPLAMAGIMGGLNSGVSANTKHLFLESAFFQPKLMAGKARRYGMHTDASHRYERGVDFELQREAMERATALFIEAVGGVPGPINEAVFEDELPQPEPVLLRRAQIALLLGVEIADAEVERILQGLGFWVVNQSDGWMCTAPSWRFDMGLEADLIEELARVIGYDAIPSQPIRADLKPTPVPENKRALASVKNSLVAQGFFEAITFSFVAAEQQNLFDPDMTPVTLRNPISSDLSVMRTSLIPGLLKAVAHNASRQASRVRLFETGLQFLPGEQTVQQPTLAMVQSGDRDQEAWSNPKDAADFFDLKGVVETLLGASTRDLRFERAIFAGLHDGQSAAIVVAGEVVGKLGRVHPVAAKQMGVPANTCVAELRLDTCTAAMMPSYADISKFPETRRDLAFLVDQTIDAESVLELVRSAAGMQLSKLELFDVYHGKGVPEGKKSLALGLTFRDQSRTLDEAEVTAIISQVVDSLTEKLDIELRA
jgi:phenylalanyl-tRNA synthetase beta chain